MEKESSQKHQHWYKYFEKRSTRGYEKSNVWCSNLNSG